MTLGSPTTPPAGWLDDPDGSGRQRWWDGTAWTEHYRSTEAAGAGPQEPATASANTWTVGQAGSVTAGLSDRTWITLAHASALISLWAGLSFLGPLIVYALRKDDSPEIRAHAAAALNFQLSWSLWGFVLGIAAVVLAFVLVGFLLFPVLAVGVVVWLVITIVASVRASQGGAPFSYPLTIPFVN